jgi:hypothetical protein
VDNKIFFFFNVKICKRLCTLLEIREKSKVIYDHVWQVVQITKMSSSKSLIEYNSSIKCLDIFLNYWHYRAVCNNRKAECFHATGSEHKFLLAILWSTEMGNLHINLFSVLFSVLQRLNLKTWTRWWWSKCRRFKFQRAWRIANRADWQVYSC